MSAACPGPDAYTGLIRALLGAVDCNVRAYSQAGYQALTAPNSLFPTALSILLVIYVAIIGYRMMFGLGGLRIGELPVIGLRIGLILAVGLGWSTFQTLVFNLAMDAPLQVAQVVGGPAARSGSALAADPLGGLQTAYDQLVANAEAFGRAAGANAQVLTGGPARASEGLWRASTALFLTTAGLLVLAQVSVGVLTAIGPIFIALFLFDATRGLFVGWVRALAGAALAPLVCWVGVELQLIVLEPWLVRLAQQRASGALDIDTAYAASAVVLAFAAAQVALLSAGTAIAGGFRLGGPRARGRLVLLAVTSQAAAGGIGREPRPDPCAAARKRGRPRAGGGLRRFGLVGRRRAGRGRRLRRGGQSTRPAPLRAPGPIGRRPMKGFVVTLAFGLALLAGGADAALRPAPGAVDPRIRLAPYDPDEVYEIAGVLGYSLTLEFGEGERIENVAIGDSLGWQVTPNRRANLLFLKPMDARPGTNMTVITNLRRYNFQLSVRARPPRARSHLCRCASSIRRRSRPWPEPPPPPNRPGREPRLQRHRGRTGTCRRGCSTTAMPPTSPSPKAPDYPAIFVIDEKRRKSVVNVSFRDGFLVVDQVAPGFALRDASGVALIHNDAYQARRARGFPRAQARPKGLRADEQQRHLQPAPETAAPESPVLARGPTTRVGRRESPFAVLPGVGVAVLIGLAVFASLSHGRAARAQMIPGAAPVPPRHAHPVLGPVVADRRATAGGAHASAPAGGGRAQLPPRRPPTCAPRPWWSTSASRGRGPAAGPGRRLAQAQDTGRG